MTEIEKLKRAVAELDTDPDAKDLLHRLLQKIEGQALAFQNLEAAKAKVVERHDRYRKERNEARFKAQALESVLVEVVAEAVSWSRGDIDFRGYVSEKLAPLAKALGHSYLREYTR